ncbi:hypothetical protein [Hydrogenibacillus sp. N12]|uniref:DNA repair protein RecN n=1 Tax=Hydrogenibacillus sp. N12 TaxID=2866627 RepID=UPI001C7E06A8|nr:hypothetical protein [Hydrogenibacillus sp. N12]QZA32027.1 hypothetical protein K2M58_06620 [Hydrogenibacillus sp. N12]
MLITLSVENVAVFPRAKVEWAPGMNVLTGESGAGKSLLLEALALLVGERAREDVVRRGARAAVVEGRWLVATEASVAEALQAVGAPFDAEDGLIVIRREIVPGGRSTVRLNGALVPLSALRAIAPHLIVWHRQHDELWIAEPNRLRTWIDALGGQAVAEARARYRAAYERYREAYVAAARADARRAEARARREAYEEALADIRAVRPKAGEDAALWERRNRLLFAERIRSALARAYRALSDEHRALDLLRVAEAALRELEEADPALAAYGAKIAELRVQLEEIAAALVDAGEALEAEGPEMLQAVEERLEALERLKKRYGGSLEAVLRTAEEAEAALSALDDEEAAREAEQKALAAFRDAWLKAGAALFRAREEARALLEAKATAVVRTLELPAARLIVRLDPVRPEGAFPDPSGWADGLEAPELLFQPHPGDPPRPLHKAASGGELSRVALALFAALAEVLPPATFIFDEIDTGVGGSAGEAIGEAMARLALRHQVIAVTHLAQVAAFADAHFRLSKRVTGEGAASAIERLAPAEADQELARLISGEVVTEAALRHAAFLRRQAEEKKAALLSGAPER